MSKLQSRLPAFSSLLLSLALMVTNPHATWAGTDKEKDVPYPGYKKNGIFHAYRKKINEEYENNKKILKSNEIASDQPTKKTKALPVLHKNTKIPLILRFQHTTPLSKTPILSEVSSHPPLPQLKQTPFEELTQAPPLHLFPPVPSKAFFETNLENEAREQIPPQPKFKAPQPPGLKIQIPPKPDFEAPKPPGFNSSRSPTQFYQAFLTPCCTPIVSGAAIQSSRDLAIPGSPTQDPYVTGRNKALFAFKEGTNRQELRKLLKYSYQAPHVLGNYSTLPKKLSYALPKEKVGESKESYYDSRLSESLNLPPPHPNAEIYDTTTFAGAGSMSWAYFIHPPVPSDKELSEIYPHSDPKKRRKIWAIENATDVIKLRQPSPWGKGMEVSAQMLERDLAASQLFTDCAKGFKVHTPDGLRPLIEGVPYENAENMNELSRGIVRQKAVNGPSVYFLAKLTEDALRNNPKAIEALQGLGFETPSEAALAIQRVQAFYLETHNDVINFMKANHFEDVPAGRTITADHRDKPDHLKITSSGFDYNNGENIIWDQEKKIFRAIDF